MNPSRRALLNTWAGRCASEAVKTLLASQHLPLILPTSPFLRLCSPHLCAPCTTFPLVLVRPWLCLPSSVLSVVLGQNRQVLIPDRPFLCPASTQVGTHSCLIRFSSLNILRAGSATDVAVAMVTVTAEIVLKL